MAKIEHLTTAHKSLILLFIGVFCAVFLGLKSTALAEDFTGSVEWIDRGHIKVDGKIYTDTNIYDETNRFQGDGCSVIDMNSGLDADIVIDVPTGTSGGCVRQEIASIANDGNKNVTAYKVGDNAILAVNGITCNVNGEWSDTVGFPPVTISFDIISEGAYYRKIPESNPLHAALPDDQKNNYLRMGDPAFPEGDRENQASQNGSGGQILVFDCVEQDWNRDLTYANGGNIVDALPEWAPPLPAGVVIAESLEPPDGGEEGEAESTCEANNAGGFSWLFCGVLEAVDDGVQGIIDQAYGLLSVDTSLYDNPKLQQSWAYFRNIASALLVVVGLVMIIGQAIGRD